MCYIQSQPTETNLSDIDGNANEGAIVVANDLGIVTGYPDGTFKPTALVTRAEFAAMMTRALNIPESALKGFKASSFKDVASDYWAVAYLGYCNSKGIMTGYEDGTARPGQTITVNEAITMVCRAIGYTNQAKELVGSWPANYIALGKTLGLYDDVEAVATTDRASAAQMIYNALDKDLVYINADGNTVRQVVKEGDGTPGNPTVYNSMLRSLGGNDVGELVLTDTLAKTAVVNVNDHIGEYVNAWVNNDGDIIAIETLSTKLTGDFNATKGEFETDDTVYYLKYENANYDVAGTATSPKRFDNGTYSGEIDTVGIGTSAAINVIGTKAVFDAAMEYDTRTINVKLSGKTIKEVYSVMHWDVTNMDKFESGDLDTAKAKINVNGTEYKFEKDKNGEIDMSSFALVGVSSLSKIAEGNVVEVWTEDGTAAKPIVKLAVGTKTVTGDVTEMNKKGTKFTIDGTKYGLSEFPSDVPAVGDTGTAYLTAGGDIAYWKKSNSVTDNYAVFYGWDKDTTLKSTTTLAGLVLKNGNDKSFEFTSTTTVTSTGSIRTDGYTANGSAYGVDGFCLVNYNLDSKGKLSEIAEITMVAPATAGAGDQTAVIGTLNAGRTRINNTKFAENAVIFLKDGSDFEVGSLSSLSTDDNVFTATNNWVALNDDGEIAALVMEKTTALGSENSFGIITGLVQKTKDNSRTWYVQGFLNGKAFEGATKYTGGTKAPAGLSLSDLGSTLSGLYLLDVDTEGTVKTINYDPTVSGKAIGKVVKSVDKANKEVTDNAGQAYGLTDDVVVYFYDADEEEYVLADINRIGKGKNISFISTGKKAWDDSNKYNVVILWD